MYQPQMANFIRGFTCIRLPSSQTRTRPETRVGGFPNPKPGFGKMQKGSGFGILTRNTLAKRLTFIANPDPQYTDGQTVRQRWHHDANSQSYCVAGRSAKTLSNESIVAAYLV